MNILNNKNKRTSIFKAFETWAIVGIMYLIVITILSYLIPFKWKSKLIIILSYISR